MMRKTGNTEELSHFSLASGILLTRCDHTYIEGFVSSKGLLTQRI
jgi:hypothetical protein